MDTAAILGLFQAGVQAADPAQAVARALGGQAPTQILAIGKAARAMAAAALAAYPGVPALVVTNPENAQPLDGAEVLVGDHPVPTARSAQAGVRVLAMARALGAGDRLLALVSGGASALVVAPVAGVTLRDKAALSRAMLGAGLDIGAMNTVRQHLSRIKGGGLARAAAPAQVESLLLSDVIGDDPRIIASGPTQAPLGTAAQARAVLEGAGLWEGAPRAVRAALSGAAAPAPFVPGPCRIVGSNAISLGAMAAAARAAGYAPEVAPAPLVGDVAQAADVVLARAAQGPGLWLAGGETTVRLRGTGQGGRNQELALRVARGLAKRGLAARFLSAGTDGRDGPTDAAGGLVDHTTWGRIGEAAEALLANNDSYAALGRADALVKRPATGTNVADLQVLWVG